MLGGVRQRRREKGAGHQGGHCARKVPKVALPNVAQGCTFPKVKSCTQLHKVARCTIPPAVVQRDHIIVKGASL